MLGKKNEVENLNKRNSNSRKQDFKMAIFLTRYSATSSILIFPKLFSIQALSTFHEISRTCTNSRFRQFCRTRWRHGGTRHKHPYISLLHSYCYLAAFAPGPCLIDIFLFSHIFVSAPLPCFTANWTCHFLFIRVGWNGKKKAGKGIEFYVGKYWFLHNPLHWENVLTTFIQSVLTLVPSHYQTSALVCITFLVLHWIKHTCNNAQFTFVIFSHSTVDFIDSDFYSVVFTKVDLANFMYYINNLYSSIFIL